MREYTTLHNPNDEYLSHMAAQKWKIAHISTQVIALRHFMDMGSKSVQRDDETELHTIIVMTRKVKKKRG